ncbi:glycosyltransferase family 2 protein, partial [Salmonella enterica]|nr:glycosyltransferase family 2 protein [Salmonella enterica]
GHYEIIKKLGALSNLTKNSFVKIIIKDNLGEKSLEEFCYVNNITYLKNSVKKGFGKNNNEVFNTIAQNIKTDDFFVVMNPDVFIDANVLLEAVYECDKSNAYVATVNLYRDFDKKEYDNSIRKFPCVMDFIHSFLFGKNKCSIDKDGINEPLYVDWAAGSFLIFKAEFFSKLNGFNEKYFMYCEDIDICWRANKIYNTSVLYLPQYVGVHLAQFNNRKILSRHFLWHIKSIILFLMYKNGFLTINKNDKML